jgi:hypothetical protein
MTCVAKPCKFWTKDARAIKVHDLVFNVMTYDVFVLRTIHVVAPTRSEMKNVLLMTGVFLVPWLCCQCPKSQLPVNLLKWVGFSTRR